MIEEGQRVDGRRDPGPPGPVPTPGAARAVAVAAGRRRNRSWPRRGAAGAGRKQPGAASANWPAKKLVAASALDAAVADRDSPRRAPGQACSARSRSPRTASDIAELGVDNTVIRAPFAGVIVAKAAQPGEMISPISGGGGSIRTGIGTLVDMDSLEVQVDVNEAYIGRVQPKMPVEAVLNAYPDWKIPGRGDRDRADRRPRQGHGQGAHRAEEKDAAHRARHGRARELPRGPGQGQGRRRAAADRRRVRCPPSAIVDREGKTVVFVVDGRARDAARSHRRRQPRRQAPRSPAAWPPANRSCCRPATELTDGAKVAVASRLMPRSDPATTIRGDHVRYPGNDPATDQDLHARQADGGSAARHRPGHSRAAISSR